MASGPSRPVGSARPSAATFFAARPRSRAITCARSCADGPSATQHQSFYGAAMVVFGVITGLLSLASGAPFVIPAIT